MRGERATLGKSLLDVQRELKIKATYIAAIENANVSAFETQGFIAGYVRSYARYLGMDPDEAFRRFCVEANFTTMHGMEVSVSSVRRDSPCRPASELRDPFADPNALFIPRGESFLNNIEPGAVGSVAVLLALIGGIGYGGWSVLQQVQRVQVAPVDQAPRVVAEIDPLGNVTGVAPLVRSAPASTELELAEADPAQLPDLMGRLYRPQAQALDVPVLVSRDGPIAAIDPRRPEGVQQASLQMEPAAPSAAEVVEAAVQVAEAAPPSLELLAVRPSWVRVQAADGTVLFEKILNAGERYSVPQMEQAPLLRAGNSGSVYFAVNGQTYGPAAPGAQVVKNVPLSPEALTGKYAVADLSRDTDLARYTTVAQNDTN